MIDYTRYRFFNKGIVHTYQDLKIRYMEAFVVSKGYYNQDKLWNEKEPSWIGGNPKSN